MSWLAYFNLILCIFHTEALIGQNIRQANDYEFSFVVSIGTKNPAKPGEENHFCTGVLISHKAVLTCAHCFDGETKETVQVIVGNGNLATGKRHDVASWTTFNSWAISRNRRASKYGNDIAVLFLSKPVYDAKIKPVKLASMSLQQLDETNGTEAIIAGFGVTNNGSRSGHLLTGSVSTLSREECEERMFRYSNEPLVLYDSDFCSAAEPFILTSGGDSGGPILNANNELLGINMGICPPGQPWYAALCPQDEKSLKRYKTNLHLSADYHREFINSFR